MTKDELDVIVVKESRRCAGLLQNTKRLTIPPKQFVNIALEAKAAMIERYGGVRIHTDVINTACDSVNRDTIANIGGGAYLTNTACNILSRSLLASQSICVADLVRYYLNGIGWSTTCPEYKATYKLIRKGQKLLPAIIKYYAKVIAQWREERSYNVEYLNNFDKQLAKVAEQIGQLHASQQHMLQRKVTLSFAPSSFVKLAGYGCDHSSCYQRGGAHEHAKYALAMHPTAFVMLVYAEDAPDAEPNALRRGPYAKPIARMWGIMHPSVDAAYINNVYQGDRTQYQDTLNIANAALSQIWNCEVHEYDKPSSNPLAHSYSKHVYLNATPRIFKRDKDLGVNSIIASMVDGCDSNINIDDYINASDSRNGSRLTCDYCGNYADYIATAAYDKNGEALATTSIVPVVNTSCAYRDVTHDRHCGNNRLCASCIRHHDGAIYCPVHVPEECHMCHIMHSWQDNTSISHSDGTYHRTCNACYSAGRNCYCGLTRQCGCEANGGIPIGEERPRCVGRWNCVPREEYEAARVVETVRQAAAIRESRDSWTTTNVIFDNNFFVTSALDNATIDLPPQAYQPQQDIINDPPPA